MKKMIIRLLVAKMIPVAFGFVKKAFSKKKSASKKEQTANQALQKEGLDVQALEANGQAPE